MAGACLSPCTQGQGNEPGAPFQSELVSVILKSKDRQYVCCLVDHYKHDCRVYESQIGRKVDCFTLAIVYKIASKLLVLGQFLLNFYTPI